MTILADLQAITQQWQSGAIDFDEFAEKHNAKLEEIKNLSDADKIKAFDVIAKQIVENLTAEEEYESDMLYHDSDNDHYLTETVQKAVFGKDFYKWHNKLYSGG